MFGYMLILYWPTQCSTSMSVWLSHPKAIILVTTIYVEHAHFKSSRAWAYLGMEIIHGFGDTVLRKKNHNFVYNLNDQHICSLKCSEKLCC